MVNQKHKVIIITQARIGSRRLPSKTTKQIGDETILSIHLKRLQKSKLATKIVVATTFEKKVKEIIEIVNKCKVKYFQGSTVDVLDRYYQAAKIYNPEYIVRVTSDCPLIDPELIDKMIDFTIKNDFDYVSNVFIPNYPDGQDIEIFKFSALNIASQNSTSSLEREHVTPYIIKNSTFNGGNIFKSCLYPEKVNYEKIRMTIDYEEDYDALQYIISQLGFFKSWEVYAKFIIENSEKLYNQKIIRNDIYFNS
tara:strand:- start:4713 stop:5468 length:756 start_codon:yes stop_codon:yes gene_type:complete